MLRAFATKDEFQRLEKLRDLDILDTEPELKFDEITRDLARLLDVPIALISLVDEDRQWFKSHYGIDATETPRAISFCGHAIQRDGLFIVNDATTDCRFSDNPLVVGDPRIRFYLGVPLKTHEGCRIGTLCAIDRVARSVPIRQLDYIEMMAAQVIDMMEQRKILRENSLYPTTDATSVAYKTTQREVEDFLDRLRTIDTGSALAAPA